MNLVNCIIWIISAIVWAMNYAQNLDEWYKLLLSVGCFGAAYYFGNKFQKDIMQ